jgi:hypothetical protein
MSYNELKNLQTSIEELSMCHQQAILKILVENQNQNQNYEIQEIEKKGCFIQLNKVPIEVLEKIQTYMIYVQNQEQELVQTELEKENMKKMFVAKSFHGAP